MPEELRKASSWLLPLEFITSGGAYLLLELDRNRASQRTPQEVIP
ncbi:hypothetical protein Pr1d_31660 [Bythopirellula goksoeyrii]|uniref:Uncharacterized protein n=1 Tax=Bythopirellula goksoeyrii TaxID=1400387 RepID=A0A5B9QE00_9BACT|nr:hypothetical protein Pr1d_31660 [Bythopirellula goksoeyrii]